MRECNCCETNEKLGSRIRIRQRILFDYGDLEFEEDGGHPTFFNLSTAQAGRTNQSGALDTYTAEIMLCRPHAVNVDLQAAPALIQNWSVPTARDLAVVSSKSLGWLASMWAFANRVGAVSITPLLYWGEARLETTRRCGTYVSMR